MQVLRHSVRACKFSADASGRLCSALFWGSGVADVPTYARPLVELLAELALPATQRTLGDTLVSPSATQRTYNFRSPDLRAPPSAVAYGCCSDYTAVAASCRPILRCRPRAMVVRGHRKEHLWRGFWIAASFDLRGRSVRAPRSCASV